MEENKQIVLDAFRAILAGDLKAYLARLDDDIEYTFFGDHRFGRTFRGKDDLVANMLKPVAQRIKGGIALQIDNVIAEGDHVVLESRGEAVTQDGKPYNNRYCVVVKVMNQKIVEIREYLDTALLRSIFGPLDPAPE